MRTQASTSASDHSTGRGGWSTFVQRLSSACRDTVSTVWSSASST
ncbi:hypothetical protein ACN28S_09035 [Cystobacter fuscus]